MTIKQVLEKYHKIVPFPVSLTKIKKAGQAPKQYLQNIVAELNQCSDADSCKSKKLLASLNETLASL